MRCMGCFAPRYMAMENVKVVLPYSQSQQSIGAEFIKHTVNERNADGGEETRTGGVVLLWYSG